MKSKDVVSELHKIANPDKARILAGFFKTGKGEYGEGDVFLGITVPLQRGVAKRFKEIKLDQLSVLLKNPIHECRLTALEILVMQYEDAVKGEDVVNFYLKNTRHINNWDLVDLSAQYILGDWLLNCGPKAKPDRKILYKLVKSKNIWERRIAIISTFAFIRAGKFEDTFKLAKILMRDEHDLIHKAVGWMLREVGKRDEKVLVKFLNEHAVQMPRTMLRYAIEKFSLEKRKKYLNMKS